MFEQSLFEACAWHGMVLDVNKGICKNRMQHLTQNNALSDIWFIDSKLNAKGLNGNLKYSHATSSATSHRRICNKCQTLVLESKKQ